MAVDEIMNLIPIQDVEGITISGGEPFEQPEELSKLLTLAALSDLHRLVYTGYRYEELKTMKNWSIDLCLGLTDMLIDGAYDWTIPQKHPWAGSGNQRILFLEQGKIVDDQETLEAMGIQEAFTGLGEITIDSLGGITATGFMDSQVLQEKA